MTQNSITTEEMQAEEGRNQPRSPERRKRMLRRPRVLFWPSSSLRRCQQQDDDDDDDGFFVVGWNIEASPAGNWPVETHIVAGVISISCTRKERSALQTRTALQQAYRELCSKLESIAATYCSCRHDCEPSSNDHARTCAACTSHDCLEGLSVLAIILPPSGGADPELDARLYENLPVMDWSRGHPWWTDDVTNNGSEERQLVYYDDSNNCLYSHGASAVPTDLFFSAVVLCRLTHAATVLQAVRNDSSTTTAVSISKDSPAAAIDPPRNSARKSAPRTNQPPPDETQQPSPRRFARLLQQSLVWRHCESVDSLPLLLFFRLLLSSKRKGPIITHNCHTCHKPQLLDAARYVCTEREFRDFDNVVVSGLDALTGLALGILLAYWLVRDSTGQTVTVVVREHYDLFRQGVEWLDNFPIGFKLNEKLTENIGRELRTMLAVHEGLLDHVIATTAGNLANVAALTCLLTGTTLGGSGLLALLFDLFRLGTMHIAIFAACFRKIYRSELYLLAALWRLFRGKKKNMLRSRTDSMNYDSMQLLLGTILFAVALFLFTTALVYHTFFATLNFLVSLLSLSLLMPYLLARCFPWGRLTMRRRRPGILTCNVYIANDASAIEGGEPASLDITRLVPVPRSYGSIVSAGIAAPAKALASSQVSLFPEFFTGVSSTTPVIDALICATTRTP